MTETTINIVPLAGCDEKFSDLLNRDVEIPYGRFFFPCRLKINPEALYLSVQLHGSAPRGEKSTLPVFARWNWGNILGAHVLSICDPTIYLDDTLGIGWYLGDRHESVIPGIVAIAERCAERIGISADRIVFSGSSGGGFAALQAAAVAKNGRAIAINAQTNLSKYEITHVNNYIDKVSECVSLQEAERAFAQRWNAISRMQQAVALGHTPKIVLVQNRNEWHFQKHFTPFASTFGLNLLADQSICGNFMSILYDGTNIHGPEPTEVVKRINSEGIPFLLNKEVASSCQKRNFTIAVKQKEGEILAEIRSDWEEADKNYQYACYLLKNGAAVEKIYYTAKREFVFNLCGAGQYKCHGYVRDQSGLIFSDFSEVVDVKEC